MKDKVDKGFELIYWRLSYRRKLMRTLWFTPITVLAIVLIFYAGYSTTISVFWIIVIVAVYLAQLIYNYRKWKSQQPQGGKQE